MARVRLNLRSPGVPAKIAKGRHIVTSMTQVLTAAARDHDGELFLSWKPVPNTKSYVIESSTNPATVTSWENAGVAASATKTISNLKSGTRFWFRVAAGGAGGQSGWSEQATKVAP